MVASPRDGIQVLSTLARPDYVADKDGSPVVAYDSWVEEIRTVIQEI
jgi:hypothetical protein